MLQKILNRTQVQNDTFMKIPDFVTQTNGEIVWAGVSQRIRSVGVMNTKEDELATWLAIGKYAAHEIVDLVEALREPVDQFPAYGHAIMPRDVEALLIAGKVIINRIGTPIPTLSEAIFRLLRFHTRRIINGGIEPLDGINELYFDVFGSSRYFRTPGNYHGESHRAEFLSYLYLEAYELQSDPEESIWREHFGTKAWLELAKDVIAQSRYWILNDN